ncbi:MAG: hypothetical protein R2747_01940 [Pyrinomonadaceae bacterium]
MQQRPFGVRICPDYLDFAASGGGEMLDFSPDGRIVLLPFIGMNPKEELSVADSREHFERMLVKEK